MSGTVHERMTPPPSAQHIIVQEGEAFIWEPQSEVVVQVARGVLSLPLAHCFADFYRPILVPGVRVRIFDDFEGLTHYTREAREHLTRFTLERLSTVEVIHVLLSSKFMALGVGAFKHDIGDERVHVYSDRESFLRSFAETLQLAGAGSSRRRG
jgi:hypothetical protein